MALSNRATVAWVAVIGFVVLTLVIAVETQDGGPFRDVLAERTYYSNFGQSDQDHDMITADLTTDKSVKWDNSSSAFATEAPLIIEAATASFALDDTDTSNASNDFNFQAVVNDGTASAEYVGARFTALVDGTARPLVDMRTTDNGGGESDDYILEIFRNGLTSVTIGYHGTANGYRAVIDGDHQELESVKPIFSSTADDCLYMKTADGTCSCCKADNSDNWSCSSVTCP